MHRVPASQLCRHLAVRKASVAWDTRTRHSLFEAVSGWCIGASDGLSCVVATLPLPSPAVYTHSQINRTARDILDRSALVGFLTS